MSEVKHHWPEELVGTGELVVYLSDYEALKARVAELEARQVPLSRQFVDAVKQLCKDFSDRQGRPYMGDVYAALDGLLEYEQIPVAAPQAEQSGLGKIKKAFSKWTESPSCSTALPVELGAIIEALDQFFHAEQYPTLEAEQFCDDHCTWLDHHPGCKLNKEHQ